VQKAREAHISGEPQGVPTPLYVTIQIREFLGAAGFCQIQIPNFSLLAKPPYEAINGGEWELMEWVEKQKKKALKKLRGHSKTPLLWACQI
jgi:hypothetical protein